MRFPVAAVRNHRQRDHGIRDTIWGNANFCLRGPCRESETVRAVFSERSHRSTWRTEGVFNEHRMERPVVWSTLAQKLWGAISIGAKIVNESSRMVCVRVRGTRALHTSCCISIRSAVPGVMLETGPWGRMSCEKHGRGDIRRCWIDRAWFLAIGRKSQCREFV